MYNVSKQFIQISGKMSAKKYEKFSDTVRSCGFGVCGMNGGALYELEASQKRRDANAGPLLRLLRKWNHPHIHIVYKKFNRKSA